MSDRLIYQYQDSPLVKLLVELVSDYEEISDIAEALRSRLDIDVSEGRQLDLIGDIVGESRLGRSDADYRQAIRLRVDLNYGSGEGETLIRYVIGILGATQVQIIELYPAKLEIFVDVPVTLSQAESFRALVAAGVGTLLVTSTDGNVPFGVSELGFAPLLLDDGEPLLVNGSPLLVLDGSTVGEEFDDIDGLAELGDDPLEGGEIAELFEVA